jgi:hypothetical protein
MKNIFIAHTPLLLEEFPFSDTMFFKHEVRTPKRTAIFTEALQSLGSAVRINLTLWLLATEHSASEVSDRILNRLKAESRTDDAGDIFVIEADTIACTTSQDTANQVQAIFDGGAIPISQAQPPPKTPANLPKKKVSFPFAKLSRREQIAEEYGIKPTDAMLRKVTGSFESGKR